MVLRIRLFLGSLFLGKVATYYATSDNTKNRVVTNHMPSHCTNGCTFEATGRVCGTAGQ